MLGKISSPKSGQVLEWAAQGCGGVTVPGNAQEMCKYDTCRTWFSGKILVVGGWLD